MNASSAIVAGVCFVAVTALAQPKGPITKDSCRPGPSCASGEVLSKGQCCERAAPERVKKPTSVEKPSPIEGFELSNIHSFEVGELPTKCVVDRKRGELTLKTKIVPAKASGTYGGCCFEHTEALSLNADTSATAAVLIPRTEELVRVTLEQSSGALPSYLHNGRLEAGSHELLANRLGLNEVRRLCVAVFGVPESAPHDALVTIKRVTFGRAVTAQR
jgi:hypothetical protein